MDADDASTAPSTDHNMPDYRSLRSPCLRTILVMASFTAGCSTQQSEQPGAVVKGQPTAEKADSEKEEFIQLVRQNADDPDRLEIVLWGEKKDDKREARFRCAQVGTTKPSITYRLGTTSPPRPPAIPVMLEDADIRYKDGKIEKVYLNKTYQVWEPR